MAKSPAELLRGWVIAQAPDAADWITESLDTIAAGAPERDLHIVLGMAPRRLGKADLVLDKADLAAADAARPGWSPEGWSIDGAMRVLALLVSAGNRPFAERFKDLRRTADVAEMIALYRGLPLYPDPETLEFETGEGLRSNIRTVFEAIAHNNPYPRDHFDEHRWNHMVLKALFVGSRLSPILGLTERANPELARILVDYARERWAAGRPVTDELWISVRAFRDDPAISGQLDDAIRTGHLTKEALQ
ncbi:MAG: EboA domain-containing protein [Rhodobacter sp.]|nr:EboA domain-containing protein [Rhodobacter sp.]